MLAKMFAAAQSKRIYLRQTRDKVIHVHGITTNIQTICFHSHANRVSIVSAFLFGRIFNGSESNSISIHLVFFALSKLHIRNSNTTSFREVENYHAIGTTELRVKYGKTWPEFNRCMRCNIRRPSANL